MLARGTTPKSLLLVTGLTCGNAGTVHWFPGELRPAGRLGRPAGRCAYLSVLACCYAGQLVTTAVSSTTKEVCSEESSTPVNFTVTLVPAKLPSE